MRSKRSAAIRLRRRGEYAICIATVALLVVAVALLQAGLFGASGAAALVFLLLLSILSFSIHTTRRGKFLVWREILDELSLRGDERVLDVGCGRGAVLTMLAERVPHGRVVGVDMWTADQSGNGLEGAERNLVAEGVHQRCEIVTGDMRSMPFPSASFDVVVSSLAIHNVPNREGRDRAIREIARVLRPGGRVALVDLAFTASYARELKSLGLTQVERQRLGWRFWWGPAVPSTQLVLAVAQTSKPAPSPSLAQQFMETSEEANMVGHLPGRETLALDLAGHCIYLAQDGALRPYARTAEFFRRSGESAELADGHVIALFDVRTPRDVHYPVWEMHPKGDELLLLLSGCLTVEYLDAAETPTAVLRPRSAIVVPAGIWHRLIVNEASALIAITPRHGTLHKEIQCPE